MNKMIVKLSLLSFMLFVTNNALASEGDKKPVDEAMSIKVPKDTIKGGDKLEDDYKGTKVSLSSLEKVHEIKRENLHFPPYRCFVYHSKDKQTEIGKMNDSTIEFKINKSLLSVGDIILVLNSQNVKSKTNPFGKFIVEEILVVE